ncbi:MAG TPA: hypothetical protein VGF48_04080 [Thermoanaerobaculia bacterium]|jgi:hypothetical protein
MRKPIAIALLLVAAACARPPVEDEVAIVFSNERETATVTARTTFQLQPRNDAERSRIDAARTAALAGTDGWTVRLSRLSPESDRITFERSRGQLERVIRTAVVPASEIERLFADASIGVQLVSGDGYRELHFYPAASGRASREQQRHFNDALDLWSRDVARYFTALHHVYAYLNDQPQRARYVFASLLGEKGSDGAPPAVLEEEQPLVDAVTDAMDRIGTRMDENEQRAHSFAEEADLIYNPFPARVTVQVPGEVIAREGFTTTDNGVAVEPVELFESIASLEGKWVRPDPLAALLRDDKLKAEDLARLPRESEPMVSATEVAEAIREQLARPRTYRIRWQH